MKIEDDILKLLMDVSEEKITPLEAYLKILTLFDVSGMFSEEKLAEAYWDGREHEESGGGMFDVENYR